MATSHGNKASCMYAKHWEESNFLPETSTPGEINVQQLFEFDGSLAFRRTELELHRIRQFACEVGVTIPNHFWDALRRVLTLRFGLSWFQCPCCEDSESKTFIMGVIALAVFNPDPSSRLFVDETINGWINQVAGHFLDGENIGGKSRQEACDLLSDSFVALDTTDKYMRPTFKYGKVDLDLMSVMCEYLDYDYYIINDQHCTVTSNQIEQCGCEGRFAVLTQSNDRTDALRVDSDVLYLNIPKDRRLTTKISGSFHLHSLKELSLICIMGSVNSPGESTFHIHLKDFKDEISSFFKRLPTIRDSEGLVSELEQLKQILDKFTNSTIFSGNCSNPKLLSLELHSQMRDHIDIRLQNSKETVNLLLKHSNLLHTVLEDLRQETFTHNQSEMNRVPDHEAIWHYNFVWLLSSLKAFGILIRSIPTGLVTNASEAEHLELDFRKIIVALGLGKPSQNPHFDCEDYGLIWNVEDLKQELNSLLIEIEKVFLQNDQSNNFHMDAINLQMSLCYLLCEYEIHGLDAKVLVVDSYVPEYLQDVYTLDEFGLKLGEVTDSSLTRFFIVSLLDNVRTIETYVEHVGKVHDLFSVMIEDARHLINRNSYARFCLEKVLPKQVVIDYLLEDINLSIDY